MPHQIYRQRCDCHTDTATMTAGAPTKRRVGVLMYVHVRPLCRARGLLTPHAASEPANRLPTKSSMQQPFPQVDHSSSASQRRRIWKLQKYTYISAARLLL
mmetsp:Transcript_12703/g.22468  ORF Transcript_12703/g.22468 Transcript_12703/m.22468 type:complete len:101 (-) Transcript_12703:495-797(-)